MDLQPSVGIIGGGALAGRFNTGGGALLRRGSTGGGALLVNTILRGGPALAPAELALACAVSSRDLDLSRSDLILEGVPLLL